MHKWTPNKWAKLTMRAKKYNSGFGTLSKWAKPDMFLDEWWADGQVSKFWDRIKWAKLTMWTYMHARTATLFFVQHHLANE